MSYIDYDYIIVNDSKEEAFKKLESIYIAEKLKTKHIKNINDFIKF